MLEKTAIDTLQKTTAYLGHYDDDELSRAAASKAGEVLAKEALRKQLNTFAHATRGALQREWLRLEANINSVQLRDSLQRFH